MEISGSILQKKIREMFPDLPTSITPEVLNKICDQPGNQPFLQWFCAHVTKDNALTEEDIAIKQHLEKSQQWVRENLDTLVEEATQECPDLLQLLESPEPDGLDCNSRYEAEREAFEEDLAYLQILENSIKTLKDEEDRLNDEIEHEQTQLHRDTIDVEERYKDCIDQLRDFDEVHKHLHAKVELLIDIYADAAEMKGPPVAWTQMPLELCRNQTEMYINYLAAYIKRHFGISNKDEHMNDSDYDTFTEDSRERRGEEMLQELSGCLKNLITSRMDEVTCKVNADACAAIEELAVNIYNNGNPKLPQTQAQLELEITELIGRRDFLEENVRLLRENPLEEAITHSAELAITEIVLLDSRLRYERREHRLSNMLRLRELAREHGHAHSDLLCMLMELQYRQVTEALEFVADARYYLATEYSLSSTRDGVMRQLQSEYETMISAVPSERNVYNKLFISMMNGNINDKDALASSMMRLRQLVRDNEADEEKIFGADLDSRINEAELMRNKVDKVYDREINSDRTTSSLKPMPFRVMARTEDAAVLALQLQKDVAARRSQLRNKLRINPVGFEWETLILWQRFLADPTSVKQVYDEAHQRLEQLHFGTTS